MNMSAPEVVSLDVLCKTIANGSQIALPIGSSGYAMAAARVPMRQRVRDLRVVSVPQGGFQFDMLVGAGCVARIEAAAVTLGEYGLAPRFTARSKAGEIETCVSTCPAVLAGLPSGEKGVSFMPLRGIIGSDLLRVRPDCKVIDNPCTGAEQGRDPIVVLAAIRPDVTLFHGLKADRNGNVWVGVHRELMTMAHASRETLVTVEHIEDTDLLQDRVLAAGTLAGLYIAAIAVVERGAWPFGLAQAYGPDTDALAAYVAAAATAGGFERWANTQLPETVG
jgi:glutaconate CoA-transferase, subunit A